MEMWLFIYMVHALILMLANLFISKEALGVDIV